MRRLYLTAALGPSGPCWLPRPPRRPPRRSGDRAPSPRATSLTRRRPGARPFPPTAPSASTSTSSSATSTRSTRPANPRNPADPAYRWPSGVDFIVNQAAANGIGLAALIQFSPPWANGGQSKFWAPDNRAFADFAFAASRRYPSIRRWIVWGEPMFGLNFQPMPAGRRTGPAAMESSLTPPTRV